MQSSKSLAAQRWLGSAVGARRHDETSVAKLESGGTAGARWYSGSQAVQREPGGTAGAQRGHSWSSGGTAGAQRGHSGGTAGVHTKRADVTIQAVLAASPHLINQHINTKALTRSRPITAASLFRRQGKRSIPIMSFILGVISSPALK